MLVLGALLVPTAHAEQKTAPQHPPALKLPRPKRLDRGMELRRDAATGELRTLPAKTQPAGGTSKAAAVTTIRARVGLVEIHCNVLSPDGTYIRGLSREDFRVLEDGAEQRMVHFDASNEPARIALVWDASPSVFREWEEMKAAARTLARNLAPQDEVAVVAFAAGAHLLLPFSRDRDALERSIESVELARSMEEKGSNIYQAIYLAVRELFGESAARRGRRAIVLLTDGQDSGLGLRWDAAMPQGGMQTGSQADRLTFEDVARALAAAGVEVYAVSTQPRPKSMSDAWLEAHGEETLVTPAARELGMPHYTVYLAELVRRAGGRLYFLREMGALSEVYRRIAETLGAQYALGYYPSAGITRPGWRKLRVEVAAPEDEAEKGQERTGPSAPRTLTGARVAHRVAYYVPTER